MIIFTIVAVWLVCGVIAIGLDFAFFQRNYENLRQEDFYSDRVKSTVTAVAGPMGLFVSLMMLGTSYGWLWPYSKKAKLEAGII